MTLRRCPCGKVPDVVEFIQVHGTNVYVVIPDCCEMWCRIIAIADKFSKKEKQQIAAQAWNDMPRGESE